ncbi:MAG: potassium/proton antiporter, partial [Gammaproteobacteria bacterium]|nr:potassium/proton antiporter [Gammaproteobacteria bacterium]
VFAGTTALQGSGFLAIYLTGIILGNGKLTALPNILQVHDGLAWLAQMSLFLILGLLVSPSQMLPVALGALAVALAMILVARPLSIILSLWPFGFRWREQAFIAWVGLRGAVPIVLALFPVMAGLPDASLLFNVAFFVVLVSLLLQGTTLAPLARRLKLEVPGDKEPDRRIPLAVPAAGEHELVLYPLQGPRWQEPIRLRQLRLPHGTGVAAIFRNGHYLAPQADLQIGPQDVIALFSTERQLGDLGKLFSGDRIPRHLNERAFFGEFVLSGEALLADLRQAYGVSIDSLPESLSLAECFLRLQHGHPVVGDRLHLGNVQLVVKAMEGDQVTRVGLKLGHDH